MNTSTLPANQPVLDMVRLHNDTIVMIAGARAGQKIRMVLEADMILREPTDHDDPKATIIAYEITLEDIARAQPDAVLPE